MTDTNSMEIRFVELMSQLFQLDEAERLDSIRKSEKEGDQRDK